MNLKPILAKYLKEIAKTHLQGDAREETFYPALKAMLEEAAKAIGKANVRVTSQPRPTDAGNPDFRLWDGGSHIFGYFEAKKPSSENLSYIENSEQLQRYLATFHSLVLTNFLEFRFYRDGRFVGDVMVGRPAVLHRAKTAPPPENADAFAQLLAQFLEEPLPKNFTAETLAVELAKRTRFFRDVVAQQLAQERQAPGMLAGFFEAFRKYLIGDLAEDAFADLFAQTVAYGLFAARLRLGEAFSRQAAFGGIPRTIGVLRDMFRFISLDDLPEELAWCVDDIVQVLAAADAPGILDRYYRDGKGGDPVVHFYETFLAQYDPAERERRGVYYTPEPVVGYIVRSLNGLLKTEFGKGSGLASEGVTLLDPAAGTMTFVARAAELAVAEFAAYGKGAREDFIKGHILENFYAFELMMAPYAIGHLKMGFFLEELGHRLADDERVKFYLTNTLDDAELEQSHLPGFSALAEESRMAGEVKKQAPILVVLGNPPYSFSSSNVGPWIQRLVNDYKVVDGQPMKDKKIGVIQDDYVKFLRFAQWKIEQAGRGVVGMITNHSYLDSPSFRGMRQSLMRTFDNIYVLDLHGNSLKGETCPDGSPDKNIFDIRQGVAIAFFIKRTDRRKAYGVVHHAELYGSRDAKCGWLNAHDRKKTEWQRLEPAAPHYLFVPYDRTHEAEYKDFVGMNQIMSLNGVGMITRKDGLTVQFRHDEIWDIVQRFVHMSPELARAGYGLGDDSENWQVARAQHDLRDSGPTKEKVVPILYRPFDIRFTYYTGKVNGFHSRPCYNVMRHMLAGENLALITPKQHKDEFGALATESIGTHKTVAAYDINYYFPLYIYPETAASPQEDPGRWGNMALFEPKETYGGKKPNLNPALVAALAAAYGKAPAPEAIFHYVYAVLYAPAYRAKYAEFLRMDFPRIPFAADAKVFRKLAALGKKLVALHLLNSPALDPPACRFEGEGDGRVANNSKVGPRYDADKKRVFINREQHFVPVPQEVWEYRIGGYQVCEKWLKDRKERRLGLNDVRTYCRMATALGKTIEIQRALDGLYPQAEKKPLAMAP